MRITIDIDQKLLVDAMRVTEQTTESAAIEVALRAVITARRREALENLRGIGWEGDLDEMRRDD